MPNILDPFFIILLTQKSKSNNQKPLKTNPIIKHQEISSPNFLQQIITHNPYPTKIINTNKLDEKSVERYLSQYNMD